MITSIVGSFEFVYVQVTFSPAASAIVAVRSLVETPLASPQSRLSNCQPAGSWLSVIEYKPAARPLKAFAPVPLDVAIWKLESTPSPLPANENVPSPPLACFTTSIEPSFAFV